MNSISSNTQEINPQQLALAIVNTPDEALKQAAKADAYGEYANSNMRKVNSGFATAIPYVDSFARAAMTKGSAGTKVTAGAKNLVEWFIFLALIKPITALGNAIFNSTPGTRRFKEQHPVAANLAVLIPGVWGASALTKVVKSGLRKLVGKYAPNLENDLKNGVNNSKGGNWFNNTAKPAIAKFAQKNPKLAKFGGVGLALAVPLLCVGLIVNEFSAQSRAAKKARKNYEEMAQLKDAIAVELANNLALKN